MPLLATALTLVLHAAAVAAPPLDPDGLRQILEARDQLIVEQIFRRRAGEVLPFIDGFLERGLRMIEEGRPEADGIAEMDLGLRFARIASRAFGDDLLERYAASFAGWSPAERTQFRAGQAAYRTGRNAERAGEQDQAWLSHRESLRIAESLEDAWGTAMSLGGLARTELALGKLEDAVRSARRAADLNRRLRLVDPEVDALLVAGQALDRASQDRAALTNYARAWAIMVDRPVSELRRKARDMYIACLERVGQTAEVERVRTADEESRRVQGASDE